MPTVSMKNLLEAGVHFGHQTRRWNPKMKPYIFTERAGIYILDLQRTLRELDKAYRFVRSVTANGGEVLFVGTKKQAQEAIAREAGRAGQPYVNERWLGGMLTNWVTIKKRISRMSELERMDADGTMDALTKKEAMKLRHELEKLRKNLVGIRDMKGLPAAVFVIDTRREMIPVAEARRLSIPLVGIVDTNCDPDEVDYVIPGNDDAIRAVNLLTRVIADAAEEGRATLEGPQVEVEERPEPPRVVASLTEPVAPAAEVPVEPPADEAPVQEAPADVSAEVVQEAAPEAAPAEKISAETPAE